jgi:hypothetical protein
MNIIKTLKNKLDTAPTTNIKGVWATGAAVFSVLAFWAAVFLKIDINEVNLGLIFSFIFSWLFDSRKQFETKRKTFIPGILREGNGSDAISEEEKERWS